MRILAFLVLFCVFIPELTAQSSSLSKKEQRRLLKEERQQEAKERAAIKMKLTEVMVNSARFVLEADMLTNKYGSTISVPSNLNFILIDSLYGIIQIGDTYSMGTNGVGGTTLEGRAENYRISKNEKRNTFSVNYDLKTTIGVYTVSLNTYGSGKADARISGSLMSGSLRFSGNLVPLQESRVYKGTPY